uniref:RNA-directed DNA polymerase n=2 Tax=Lygus hesperus TaxID=30085 RepID=A0A0A9X8H3_LYGHE
MRCRTCGGSHPDSGCWYRDVVCDLCKGNHLKRVCTATQNNNNYHKTANKQVGNVIKDNSSKNTRKKFVQRSNYLADNDAVEESLFRIFENVSTKPFTTNVTINGVECRFEIDTGCGSTILPFTFYKAHFECCEMEPSDKTFLSYFNIKSKPLGVVSLNVVFEGKDFGRLPIYVVDTKGPPLLGREWFNKLGFQLSLGNSVKDPCFYNDESDSGMLTYLKNKFKKVFSSELGLFNKGKAHLEMKPGSEPKFYRARPIPFALKEGVEKEIDRLVAQGILERVDYSPYGTPIVPILKKGGEQIRICGDYKITINPNLIIDQHPLPKIETLFQKVQGSNIFAKLDLSQAYQQMELDEESRDLVTISTHKGLYRYTRLPFGVACAPAKFQKVLDTLLEGIEGVGVLLDDILIGGKDRCELVSRIEEVLSRLEGAGLTLSESKCEIGKESLIYLGFRIDSSGLHTTDEKVRAVVDAPRPGSVKELQAFLGFVTYVSKFLPKVAEVLSPLYRLLKKEVPWSWSTECDEAFRQIKQLVQDCRSLAHYDPSIPLRLTVDASNHGVAGVLSQVQGNIDRPIAFTSRTLSSSEEAYSSIHREALAIVHCVKKFHIYLFGQKWTLISDHKPLLTIFGPKKGLPACAANRLQRWALFLSIYSYEMEYVASKNNSADWLSRAPLPDTVPDSEEFDLTVNYVFGVNSEFPLDFNDILASTKKDLILNKVIAYTKLGWPETVSEELLPFQRHKTELHVEKNVLLWGYRVVIPTILRQKVLQELHRSHMGIVKVKSLARSYVWWPKIDEDIELLVKSCENCSKYKDNPPKNSLIPWEWPEKPWSRLHIDYLGPVHNHYILVVVDSHSKWIEAFTTKNMTAVGTIRLLRESFARFGIPEVIVADNFSAFTSDEFQDFLRKNGVVFKSGAPFNPRTNGAAENAVRTVKRAIYAAIGKINEDEALDMVLQRFLLDYRNTKHITTGISPAEALLGRNLRSRLDLIRPPPAAAFVAKQQARQVQYHGGVDGPVWEIDQPVWVKNYRKGEEPWIEGIVERVLGPRRLKVLIPSLGLSWVRHCHQVRGRIVSPISGVGTVPLDTGPQGTPNGNNSTHVDSISSRKSSASLGSVKNTQVKNNQSIASGSGSVETPKSSRAIDGQSLAVRTRAGRLIKKTRRLVEEF